MHDDMDALKQRMQALRLSMGDPPLTDAQWEEMFSGLSPDSREALLKQMDVLLSSGEAASRGPPRVCACALLPRHQQWQAHESDLRNYELYLRQQGPDQSFSRTTMAAAFTHGVAPTTLHGLQRVTLAALAQRVNEIQLDRVLFARTTRRAHRNVGTTVFIEDCTGDGMELVLYNYVMEDEDPQAMLPQGQYLAVMQPYMRHTRDDPVRGRLILRCDNPQAILLFQDRQSWETACRGSGAAAGEEQPQPELPPRHASLASAKATCDRANAEFRAGRVTAAVGLYTRALDALHGSRQEAGRKLEPGWEEAGAKLPLPPAAAVDGEQLELVVRLLGNRSAALMRQDKWAAALEDADRALSAGLQAAPVTPSASAASPLPGLLAKCRFRRALALLLMQRPAEALAAAEAEPAAEAAAAAAAEWTQLRNDASHMLVEQRDGRYDLSAMRAEAAALPSHSPPRLSTRLHADYESPAVSVRPAQGPKGRSMAATSPLPAGALILASRAFVIQKTRPGDMLVSTGGGAADMNSNAQMLAPVVRQLVEQPERGAQLYSLSGGPGYEGGGGEATRVDVPRILRILANNWFDATSHTEELDRMLRHMRWQRTLDHPPSRAESARWHEFEAATRAMDKGTGLWIRPSLFNHSCVPNCTYLVTADFMMIFTTQPVQAGDELCIPYLDIYSPFAKRAAALASWNGGNGFACDCPRCSLCRQAPALAALAAELREAYERAVTLTPPTASCRSDLAYDAAMNSVMPRARRRAAHAQLDGLPAACQAGLLELLEMEGCAQMEAGKGRDALATFTRMAAIMRAVEGACFHRLRTLRTQLRLCAAALLASRGELALSTMCGILRGCCPPCGTLSLDDVAGFAERYDFGDRQRIQELLAAAAASCS